ncbi:MAG: antitoxin, RHH family protein [bacterium]
MPAKNPRLNVVLEPELFNNLRRMALKEGVSLSIKARDLIRESMEVSEDIYWAESARRRESTFSTKKALSHEDTWK